MERVPAFSQHYGKRHRLDVCEDTDIGYCPPQRTTACRQFGDSARLLSALAIGVFAGHENGSGHLCHCAPLTFRHCQKTKQIAGFPGPFVDSPILAGFTLLGLWGAPSAELVWRSSPENPARRTHAMTQKSAVVCAWRATCRHQSFPHSRNPDAACVRTHRNASQSTDKGIKRWQAQNM